MVEDVTQRRLLENVLDALDDLYDRRERAPAWTCRLLLATSVALHGTSWQWSMAEAATALAQLPPHQDFDEGTYIAALAATEELRRMLASALTTNVHGVG
jgi:hypothetical protein